MKVKLYLHGHLRTRIGKDFVEVEADTLMNALRSLEYIYRDKLKAPLDIGRWKLMIKDFDSVESWNAPLFVDEVHIYPELKFGKSRKDSAWVQIGVAVVLAVATWYVGGSGAYAAAAEAAANGTATVGQSALLFAHSAMMSTSIAMAAQGVMTLLTPQPKLSGSSSTDSKYLGSQGNTIIAGTRIPFGYGKYKIAGHFLSYNVSVTKVV